MSIQTWDHAFVDEAFDRVTSQDIRRDVNVIIGFTGAKMMDRILPKESSPLDTLHHDV